jgi:ABC-type transporter Mla subunit MlaD
MSELTAAIERLARALDQLDRATTRRVAASGKLAAALAQANAERDELEGVTDVIAARLDGAIERIRSTLEA